MNTPTVFDRVTVIALVLAVLALLVVGAYLDYRFYHPGPLSPEAQAAYDDLVAADEEGYFDLEPEDCDDPWCY